MPEDITDEAREKLLSRVDELLKADGVDSLSRSELLGFAQLFVARETLDVQREIRDILKADQDDRFGRQNALDTDLSISAGHDPGPGQTPYEIRTEGGTIDDTFNPKDSELVKTTETPSDPEEDEHLTTSVAEAVNTISGKPVPEGSDDASIAELVKDQLDFVAETTVTPVEKPKGRKGRSSDGAKGDAR